MNYYKPREDSYLLQKYVKKHAIGSVLDMGTGSGIQAITSSKNKKVNTVLAVDIDKDMLKIVKKNIKNQKIKFKHSNLFSNIKKSFDTIIFNPPYLPAEEPFDITLDGGENGYELIITFLEQAGKYLNKRGIILLLFSSLTNKDKVHETIKQNNFKEELLGKEKMHFEEIYVYKLKKWL